MLVELSVMEQRYQAVLAAELCREHPWWGPGHGIPWADDHGSSEDD
ncbi:MAG: hypothetical protein WD206_10135 [Actinomycetota bacterium]